MTSFYKFHGTGNDFILLDGFSQATRPTTQQIRDACCQHTGIGADGLIIIAPSDHHDFEMIYYNADGSKATMCGNGSRCSVAFYHLLGLAHHTVSFIAGDGEHWATVQKISDDLWNVEVSIRDLPLPVKTGNAYLINTGTPHLVHLVDDVSIIDLNTQGPILRNDKRFQPVGVNVDWFSMKPGMINVRTYEKGVEDETLSCGTGVTACALVAGMLFDNTSWNIDTKGGKLHVSFNKSGDSFYDIKLSGPAKLSFSGKTNIF